MADLNIKIHELELKNPVTAASGTFGYGEELVDFFGKLREIGVDHVIVNIPNAHEIEPLEILAADVIPTL